MSYFVVWIACRLQGCPTAEDVDIASSQLVALSIEIKNILDAQLEGADQLLVVQAVVHTCLPHPQ